MGESMATITHNSMRKAPIVSQAQEQTPLQQEFVVEDLSAFEGGPEPELPVKAVEIKPELSEEARKKIEDLIFLGRTIKTIEIAGHKFELSTLSHKEHNALAKELAKLGNESSDVWRIRVYTLSFAIRSVDGVAFDALDLGQEFATLLEKKLYVLDNMQLRVIEQLFVEFGQMLDDSEKVVTGDAIKKS
jgi:hypothetical protein